MKNSLEIELNLMSPATIYNLLSHLSNTKMSTLPERYYITGMAYQQMEFQIVAQQLYKIVRRKVGSSAIA